MMIPKSKQKCEECGEEDFSPNVEVFETTGGLVCADCAGDVLSEEQIFD
ncbi:MAG: hypothetical protein AB7G80_09895 [Dongiaceae bacterium]